MHQSTQDYSAQRFSTSSFDTELPPDARSELLQPKRPVILGPPRSERSIGVDRSGLLKWAGGFLLCAIILAGVIGHYSQSLKTPATPQQSAPATHSTPTPKKPVSQPLATPQPVSQPPVPSPPAISAPRARLVLYRKWRGNGVWEVMDSTGRTVRILVEPAPRAQLVQAPVWQPGEARIMRMPYDDSFTVRGVLKGYLSSEAVLPQIGNTIGDTWIIGRTPWTWIRVPGTAAPTWVDP